MIHEEQQSARALTLSPKMSFILGIVGGILVFCTIGFFILLSIVLKGNIVPAENKQPAPAAANVNDQAAAPAEQPGEQVGEVAPVTSDDHVLGDVNAPVTLITYTDLQCPYCEKFHTTMQQVMADYKGKVRWVYRHFPLSFHPFAMPAANAAECAAEQGKFFEFADKIFADQANIGTALFDKIAVELKLNKSKFDSCVKTSKYQARIDNDRTTGGAAGISGTPGTIILTADGGKQLIPGALPYESVAGMIDSVLK
ncbi:MAG: thioredoxin domain-containing protein [Patescibacteria group bacterium]|jgi:protein-disulfide isomerase